jgi:hypothetical protein
MAKNPSLYYLSNAPSNLRDLVSYLPKDSHIYLVDHGKMNASKLLNVFKKSLKLKGVYLGCVGTGNYPGVQAAKTSLPPGVYYGPINFDTYNTKKHQHLKMVPAFLDSYLESIKLKDPTRYSSAIYALKESGISPDIIRKHEEENRHIIISGAILSRFRF